jgi:glycosidase
LGQGVGRERVDGTLAAFEDRFPSRSVYAGVEDAREHLLQATDGTPNRVLTMEELLLLWIANQNPAFMRYEELFDDHDLEHGTDYLRAIEELRRRSSDQAAAGGDDLLDRLLQPIRAAPGSLTEQLRWIREHWGDLLDDGLRSRLTLSLDVLVEEEVAARRAFERAAGGAGAGASDAAALHEFQGSDAEPEAFSPDRDWMPELVLLAKSSYVWLDQLSRQYGRPIRTLDEIPDEELDRMRDSGFTGLWLIGLWERSHASQRIKQLRGNPEAVASAYSLMDYRIAEDLGGEPAWAALRDRAWARGIRLASDMVPNHMGIDSRWVMEHPDWFVSRDDPPFPTYSWTGPSLSSDERVGIYLEDHYADSSDAAVVFKRVDRWSGATRYVYHGNDGTSFPWNDTAQLDYLRADVREAVIQQILEVARHFPIIRFDAAMVLARRHFQRLWYPLPGTAGAIPSRAESAMSQAEFDRLMPHEFWREVVDRVAAEAPDTLLLAEAFWLLEGYFVRTLGMHRVYNSAFMHMLRDEDNAGYRKVIRETVRFDPRILGRYVNFMNNPDERTAVDQFGSGDKYLGVATLLATLPGLPMFGHGQVEGFGEKYGMEFRRARLDETPDPELIERHERWIFPMLRERWRFAKADRFRLLDARLSDGSVDEDVLAYANDVDGHRMLVAYRNRFAQGSFRLAEAGAALGVADEPDRWLILREARTGVEYLRNARDVHQAGLALELRAYQCHVFLDPDEVVDGPARDFARLAARIGDGAVADVRRALEEQLLEPVRAAVASLVNASLLRKVAGAGLSGTDATSAALVDEAARDLATGLAEIGAAAGEPDRAPGAAAAAADRLRVIVAAARASRRSKPGAGTRALGAWLGTDRQRWGAMIGWALGAAIEETARESGPATGVFDAWNVGSSLAAAFGGVGLDAQAAWRGVEISRALVGLPDGALSGIRGSGETALAALGPWFVTEAVRTATGWHVWDGVEWVRQEAWEELLDAVAARDLVSGDARSFERAARLRRAVARSGFRVGEAGEPDIEPERDVR